MKLTVRFLKTALILAILATPSVFFAQKFGIRAGLNATNVSFNLPEKAEKFGFHAGIFTEVKMIGDFLALQPELGISTQGTTYKLLGQKENFNLTNLNLYLPVAFKLSLVDIQIGPYAGYALSKGTNLQGAVDNSLKSLDFGATIGVNFYLSNFLIGARFNQGLTGISKDVIKEAFGSGKNSVGQLSVGYVF